MTARRDTQILRKRMLIMRAALERVELKENAAHLRAQFSFASAVKGILPVLAARQGLPLILAAIKKYPFLNSTLGYVATRVKAPALAKALRWAGLGVIAWQGFVWFRRYRRESIASSAITAVPPEDS